MNVGQLLTAVRHFLVRMGRKIKKSISRFVDHAAFSTENVNFFVEMLLHLLSTKFYASRLIV